MPTQTHRQSAPIAVAAIGVLAVASALLAQPVKAGGADTALRASLLDALPAVAQAIAVVQSVPAMPSAQAAPSVSVPTVPPGPDSSSSAASAPQTLTLDQ